MSTPDLWPQNLTSGIDVKAPVTILREQATLLGQKTRNLVEAQVVPWDTKEQPFSYAFYLVAPALGNYRYHLFSIGHGEDLYPVTFTIKNNDLKQQVQSDPTRFLQVQTEDDFLASLKKIFAAKKTLKVIRSILAQSTSAG